MVFGSARRGAASAGGAAGTGFLADIQGVSLDNTLFCCLDAGALDSYDGSSQTWTDQTGNGNNFYLGADGTATATDPTFAGVAGAESASELFSFDGGDYFTAIANSAEMNAFHHNSADFSIMMWAFCPTGGWDDGRFLSNSNATSTTDGISWGIQGPGTADDVFLLVLKNAESSALTEATAVTAHVAEADWNLIGLSVNEASGTNDSFFYKRSGVSSTITAFDAAYNAPTAVDATYTTKLGTVGNAAAGTIKSGTKMAGVFMFSSSLSQANMDSIYTATNGRSFV